MTSLEDYFAALHSRLATAKPVPRRKVSLGAWTPAPNECHKNVETWVAANPKYAVVRGWMIASRDETGHCLYEAHSVVGDADEIIDITLPDSTLPVSIDFLKHVGTEEEFWSVERRCSQTFYPFPTRDETSDLALEAAAIEEEEESGYW